MRGVAEAELWPIAARLQAASLTRFQGAIDKLFRRFHMPFSLVVMFRSREGALSP